jgi:hypothetical protein
LVLRRSLLSLGAGAAGVGLLAACGDDHDHDHEGEGGGVVDPGIADVVFEGGATDEALEALIAAGATSDLTQGTRFLEPLAGATLDPSTPITFRWAVGQTDAKAPSVEAPSRVAGVPRRSVADLAEPGLVERALGALLGVRTAHAHGTPIDGRAYFLVFRTESNPRLLRVFTTRLDYTPSSEAWAKLTGEGGGTITAEITGAIFEQNRIPADGGPWLGETTSFDFAG